MSNFRERIAWHLTPNSVRQAREDEIGAHLIGVSPAELKAAGGHLKPVLGSRPFRFRISPLPAVIVERIDQVFATVVSEGSGWLIGKADADGVEVYQFAIGSEREDAALAGSAGIILDWRIDDFDRTIWSLNGFTSATDEQIRAFATASGGQVAEIDRERGGFGEVTVEVPHV